MKDCEEHPECNSHNFFGAQARIPSTERESGGESEIDESSFAPILPKRMIKLGERAETARLVETPPNARYAALSYCWGRNATFMTVKDTLAQNAENIPMGDLPQTIRDAFCLTKELRLDYLWVDAICIVQKDRQEWEEESQKMGHIYSNATIVLAATRSKGVHKGIFEQRSATPLSRDDEALGSSMRARRNLNHEIIISCRTKSDYWWKKYIEVTFPLLTRGWGFQERMLATRIVHFTPTELVWECQRSRRCECGVMESDLYPVMNNLGSALRMCLKQTNDERSMRQMWREIVNSYSVRILTQIDDKLPALSGIAGLLKDCSGDNYCAGLWERSLPFDLLWRCDQSGKLQDEKRRSPSWSWISVDGAVKWPVCQNPNEEQPLKYIRSTTYFESGAEGVSVINVHCPPAGEDAYGRVEEGRLTLKARLRLTTIRRVRSDKRGYWSGIFNTEWEVLVGDSEPAPFWPDISEKGLQLDLCQCGDDMPHVFHVMEVMKSRNTPGSWEEGLVVRLIDKWKAEYKRVGVVANVLSDTKPWTTTKSWFDSPETHVMALI